jgi:hypothetical protein
MGVTQPTVLVGVGPVGQTIVSRVLTSLPRSELLKDLCCDPGDVLPRLDPLLEEILRAGRGTLDRGEQRLDLFAFTAALQGNDGDLERLCEGASRLLSERYGAVFPMGLPPEQRSAALHLLVVVPPLPSPRSGVALARLAALERWARTQPFYPLLSRVWLVSQQTAAGTLQMDELVSTCASFALAAVASGVRGDDAIGLRLRHPQREEGLFGFLSVASVDLPEARLRTYAAARAAHDALATLVKRVEEPPGDPAAAAAIVEGLHVDEWLEPFEEGAAARACRLLAVKRSGGGNVLPPDVRVLPFDRESDVRGRYPELIERVRMTQTAPSQHSAEMHETLMKLDRTEAETIAAVDRSIGALLAATLDPAAGLARVPSVEAGILRARSTVSEEKERDEARRTPDKAAPVLDADPLRENVERALAELPKRDVLLAASCAAGMGVGLLATMTALSVRSAPGPLPGAAGLSAPSIAALAPALAGGWGLSDLWPWILGLLVAGAAGYLFARLCGSRARKALAAVLLERRDALAELFRRGGGGAPGREAEAQLALRRLRVRRSALLVLEDALLRLQAVRRTLIENRDRTRRALSELGVRLGADGAQDDLSELLGPTTPLHGLLLPPRLASAWVSRCRETVEEAVWADRFLAGTFPPDARADDVPCGDLARMEELSQQQVSSLAERSLFADTEIASAAVEALRAHAGLAARALAAPCQPRNELGDPSAGLRAGDGFAVAPLAGRDALERVLQELLGRLPVLWTPLPAPRVLFMRTWEGYTVEEIARGAGESFRPPAAPGRGGFR